ncbi:SH3 domain-containing protein [Colletotrichum spaethianum]|uniref:SH3 domain-containing protein n=1 Tax=Colletotrichum spaethianum TaxID=700344 RepID=A0AA37LCW8_9PEZI|nr:SH3 domain-containing protein [Colletotrichum spaethianum]GKT46187.1 SH3 domain-containing protein [Colletotrichum spaethianum]
MPFRHKRKPAAEEPESQSIHSSPDTSSSSSSAARSTLSRRLSLSRTLSSLRPKPSDPNSPPAVSPPSRGIGAHVHKITTTAGIPFNKAANLVGAEGWFPQTMPRECAKAARILQSFTDQPLGDTEPAPSHGRNEPFHPLGITRRSVVAIPHQVLAHCAGLAIFNTLRAGAYMGSLAAGSGLVVARRPDGTWSPPSSFVVSTLGAGFMFGLDIYDCVLVLNTAAQVAAFAHPRVSLGAETSIAIGPVGTGGAVEAALSRTSRSMYSYMKSRGLWAGVQVDGTIILARQDCNGVAYNDRKISARRILQTQAEWPEGRCRCGRR